MLPVIGEIKIYILRISPIRLSVRPSVCPVGARNSKTKKHRKIKIGTDKFSVGKVKVKVTGRKTSKIWRHLYLHGRQRRRIKRGRRRLHTTPLLGLLYRRRLKPWARGRTAAYNVGWGISCKRAVYPTLPVYHIIHNHFSEENMTRATDTER